MRNNINTIPELFSLLKNHINKVTEFNSILDTWLSDSVASDLYFEAVTNNLIRQELGLPEHITISQKIITTVVEIRNSSKLYIEKALPLFKIFEILIKFSINS